MAGKKLKRSGASPGGASPNAAKRQRITQLDKRHRSEAPKSSGHSGPPRAPARSLPPGSSTAYNPLSPELLSGPHCAGLKVKPAANASKAEQRISKMLGNFARTDPSNYPTNIERNVKEAVGYRPFLMLSNNAKPKAPQGPKPATQGGPMSNTARKKKGLDPLRSKFTLESLEEMHAVWKASAAEMTETMADGLVAQRVDFHGCRLQVIQCRNPQLVGREGVVIKDSTTTAHLGGPPPKGDRDREPDVAKVYHVPKSGTTFTFLMPGRGVDPRLITILGETLGRQPSK